MAKNLEPEGMMNTIIGKGTKIEGNIEASQSMRIDGFFSGTLTATDTLIVGTTGELVDVTVHVKNAVLGGTIKGNIKVTNKVTLEGTAKLEGDLTAKLLVIEEGAVFAGNCYSGREPAPGKETVTPAEE